MSILSKKKRYKASDFPCNALPRTLRTSVLSYVRKYNIDKTRVSIVTGRGNSYKPYYVPITMDMLLEIKSKCSNKVENIDRAISILSGNGDTIDIHRVNIRAYDRMCGFPENTFSVMKTAQKSKFRLIRFYGKGNLYKGWIKYKAKMDSMSEYIANYGLNYPSLSAYSRAIYPYYGGKNDYSPTYFLSRIENKIDNLYYMSTYRCMLKAIKAIKKIEKEKNNNESNITNSIIC